MIDLCSARDATDLRQAFERAVAQIRPEAEQAAQRLRLALPLARWRPRASAAEVERIMERLLHYACQAAGPGGLVTVCCARNDAELIVCVGDSGGGVEPRLRMEAFEPPYVLGPGVVLARALAEVLGGSVIQRMEGRRGSLLLTLPLTMETKALPEDEPLHDRALSAPIAA